MTISRSDAHRLLTRAGYVGRDRRLAAVAIETDAPGGNWEYAAYIRQGDTQPTICRHPAELWAAMLQPRNREHVWYAHGGDQADWSYLLPWVLAYLDDHEQAGAWADLIMQRDRVIGVALHTPDRHRIELRDSFALLPKDLHTLADTLAPDVPHEDVGITQRGQKHDPANPEHARRTDRHVRTLLQVLTRARALVRRHLGVSVGWTVGSTSLRAFRHQMGETEYYWRLLPAVEDWHRRAYHGGLTALTTINRTQSAVSIDVNSMYPSVMRRGVPYGTPTRVYQEVDGPAFYRCDVFVPEDVRIPFLPYDDESGHVLWPRGRFITTITSDEVVFARAHGIRVEVLDGYVYPGLVHPFDQWVAQMETLRRDYRGTGLETIVKLISNALYGKFGTRPTSKDYRLYSGDVPDGWLPLTDPLSGEIAEHICWRENQVDECYMQPHWAAWITAQARLKLMAAVYALGPADVLYLDTDSITARSLAVANATLSGAVPIGPAFGQWKIEHTYDWFHVGAPKEYVGQEVTGKYVVRAAGVPRSVVRVEEVVAALDGEAVSLDIERRMSLVQQLSGRKRQTRIVRGYSTIQDSPNWEADETGAVYARMIDRGEIHVHN